MTFEHYWMENWEDISGSLRKKYPSLTDEDLAYRKGEEEQLLGRLQNKLGLKPQELQELMMQGSRPKDTYDVSSNAFSGLPDNDPDRTKFTGTYRSDDEERDKMPRTHAPRSQGYDNGKTDSGSDTDPRR